MPSVQRPWIVAHYRSIIVLMLIAASFLRIYGLNNISPPGLEHDEVAHWLINQEILSGHHAIYFTGAYGHEPAYHYLQSGFMLLMGDSPLVLRLPSAFLGLLLVAITFILARKLIGLKGALFAAALMAFVLWPIFYSRLALRAIMLPVLSALSACFWWQGWAAGNELEPAELPVRISPASRAHKWFALAGLFAGLSLYTYMASRALPIFYLLFVLYLWFFHREAFRRRRGGIVLFFLIFIVVSLPLALFLLANPGSEARISEIDAPLRALLSGNFSPVLENTVKIIGMFGLKGDPLWRQNVAKLPVFESAIGLFFYVSLAVSLWKWRKPRVMFLLLWLSTSMIPSIVTIDAPSSIRIINALPIVVIFPPLGAQLIHRFTYLSTVFGHLSPKMARILFLLGLLALSLLYISRTGRLLFRVWPADEEVQFVWQQALTDAAAYLDHSGENGPAAIGGWSPETMDPPTMQISLKRGDLSLRFFDPTTSLIIPVADNGQQIRILRPAILPLAPYLEDMLALWGAQESLVGSAVYYELPEVPVPAPQYQRPVTFGRELSFLGYSFSGEGRLYTFWKVNAATQAERRLFLHILDQSGNVVAFADALGVPAKHWQAGDLIVQRHAIEGDVNFMIHPLRLGVYNPETGERLEVAGGSDAVLLAEHLGPGQ